MNVEQLQQAMETIEENPDNITIVDNNGNTFEKINKRQPEKPTEEKE